MAEVLRFDTAESRRRTNQSVVAREGRKLLAKWRKAVEAKVIEGLLIDIDIRLAEALMNFPSSTMQGFCWAGQARLATTLNRSISTIERSVSRFKQSRLLLVKQRGNRRTCRYTFCIDDELVFQGAAPSSAPASVRGQGPAILKGLKASAPASVREESYKPSDSYKRESPPSPPAHHPRGPSHARRALEAEAAANAEKLQGCQIEGVDAAPVLSGEVLAPEGEITFDQFWAALQERDPGPAGPAVAAWRKLSADDRRAIGNLLGPHGLELDGMWATTWLKDRRWEQSRLRPSRHDWKSRWWDAADQLSDAVDSKGGFASFARDRAARGRPVELMPHSPEWNSERERMIAEGESVKLMDSWAQAGRGWTVRLRGTSE